MAHRSLIRLLFEHLDSHLKLGNSFKSKLKKQINALPDCVSFRVLQEIVEDYTGPLHLNGKGNDPNYKTTACEEQSYCEALKGIGRCNKEQCFFSTNYKP